MGKTAVFPLYGRVCGNKTREKKSRNSFHLKPYSQTAPVESYQIPKSNSCNSNLSSRKHPDCALQPALIDMRENWSTKLNILVSTAPCINKRQWLDTISTKQYLWNIRKKPTIHAYKHQILPERSDIWRSTPKKAISGIA